jgi:hypothetical protein
LGGQVVAHSGSKVNADVKLGDAMFLKVGAAELKVMFTKNINYGIESLF